MTLSERFWAKVEINPRGCWLWIAAKNDKGYGRFCVDHQNRYAHRVAWELIFGSIPNGLQVLHTCDNPPCVNPNHFWLGTDSENKADKIQKGRQSFLCGEANPRAKFTHKEIVDIRNCYQRGGITQLELARRYGISYSHLRNITHYRKWAV